MAFQFIFLKKSANLIQTHLPKGADTQVPIPLRCSNTYGIVNPRRCTNQNDSTTSGLAAETYILLIINP